MLSTSFMEFNNAATHEAARKFKSANGVISALEKSGQRVTGGVGEVKAHR